MKILVAQKVECLSIIHNQVPLIVLCCINGQSTQKWAWSDKQTFIFVLNLLFDLDRTASVPTRCFSSSLDTEHISSISGHFSAFLSISQYFSNILQVPKRSGSKQIVDLIAFETNDRDCIRPMVCHWSLYKENIKFVVFISVNQIFLHCHYNGKKMKGVWVTWECSFAGLVVVIRWCIICYLNDVLYGVF